MTVTSRTNKHRATSPVPLTDRPSAAGAHRASRMSQTVITAALGASLVVLLARILA